MVNFPSVAEALLKNVPPLQSPIHRLMPSSRCCFHPLVVIIPPCRSLKELIPIKIDAICQHPFTPVDHINQSVTSNLDIGPSTGRKRTIVPYNVARLDTYGNFITQSWSLKLVRVPFRIKIPTLVGPKISAVDSDETNRSIVVDIMVTKIKL